jgi:hypothetical protein
MLKRAWFNCIFGMLQVSFFSLNYPSADRVLLMGKGLGSDKGADGDDQGYVEHRQPY